MIKSYPLLKCYLPIIGTTKQKFVAYQLLKNLKISQKPVFFQSKTQVLCYTIFSRKSNY